MDLRLEQHVALVVGGAGFIGSAISERLRAEGATVITAGRTSGDVRMDAADEASVSSAVTAVLAEHGRIDVLVVTSAPSARTLDPARRSDPELVLDAVAGKALTFLRVVNAVMPGMVEAGYGRVVGISGQNAFLTGNLAGAVRNSALLVAAKNLADEVAGSGVTVNTVNPGQVSDEPVTAVEIGRGGESSPGQIADLVAFLASPLAGAISGESIAIGHRVRGVAFLS
ncbi:SDR family NAD(P)-dependent oxidoreductase [Agromyces silvae]|uniref:SDR family NAD(P)-dependent oxidoreductase n=1 Tax=Agromyces silvae TaxID=3388266 RepID=UPI00280BAFF7|nr:SDR family oxidoreductase [Agromyces protaetiae]